DRQAERYLASVHLGNVAETEERGGEIARDRGTLRRPELGHRGECRRGGGGARVGSEIEVEHLENRVRRETHPGSVSGAYASIGVVRACSRPYSALGKRTQVAVPELPRTACEIRQRRRAHDNLRREVGKVLVHALDRADVVRQRPRPLDVREA